MILLTTDGSDECGRVDKTCGIDAKHMAQLLIDQFGVHQVSLCLRLKGLFSIILVSCFMWGGALDSSSVLPSYP